jgi:hypothetical protein
MTMDEDACSEAEPVGDGGRVAAVRDRELAQDV